jgi:hypothetical protein
MTTAAQRCFITLLYFDSTYLATVILEDAESESYLWSQAIVVTGLQYRRKRPQKDRERRVDRFTASECGTASFYLYRGCALS